MRHDLFFGKKSVHVKLTKESHAALRQKLFHYGLTMQDLFQEAADMVLVDTPTAEKILQRIGKKKLKESLDKSPKAKKFQLGELDSETLYNLLEESEDDDRNAKTTEE